ncbi:MAG: hypothetical protein KBS41_03125, partial [Oscillospiraceae bacterium]|nr:hypothetical protein [Candidatus Equicaccousia limihippi]
MNTAAAVAFALIPAVIGADKYLSAAKRKKGLIKLETALKNAAVKAKSVYGDTADLFSSCPEFIKFEREGAAVNMLSLKKYRLYKDDLFPVAALLTSIQTGDGEAVNTAFETAVCQTED